MLTEILSPFEYTCKNCGFKHIFPQPVLVWHCPKCHIKNTEKRAYHKNH